jgi:hypothetical protein
VTTEGGERFIVKIVLMMESEEARHERVFPPGVCREEAERFSMYRRGSLDRGLGQGAATEEQRHVCHGYQHEEKVNDGYETWVSESNHGD